MKKLLVSVLALAGLAACNNELVVSEQNNSQAITFDGVFVENATRSVDPSTTTGSLSEFYVWAIIDNATGTVFDDEKVSKSGSAWGYNETQYWAPGHKYYFSAIAGDRTNDQIALELATVRGMDTKGLGTATFTNEYGTNDFLYAEYEYTTPQTVTAAPEAVKFTFDHLLSKVKFTFKNGFDNENNTIVVTNVQMKAPKVASIDLTQNTYAWTAHNGEVTLEMGNAANGARIEVGDFAASDNERLTIPAGADMEYIITFDVKSYMGDVEATTATKSIVLTGYEFEAGRAYNFVATIDASNVAQNPLFDVEFDVEVDEWIEAGDEDIYTGETAFVASAAELKAALAADEVTAVVLTEDIDLGSTTITRAEDEAVVVEKKNFTIDGNGKTLTYNGSNRVIDFVKGDVIKNATVKNLTINITSSYCERGINFNNTNGVLLVENVKFEGTAPTYAVNFPGSADGVKATIKDSYLAGNIALNVWGEKMTINAFNTEFVSVDNSNAEGYSAVKLNNDGSTTAEGTIINIEGGKIIARDEKGEPSTATSNATVTGVINVSESTEVVGTLALEQVAIVDYGTNQFYGMSSLQAAIDKVAKDKKGRVRVTKNIALTEGVKVPAGATVEIDLNGKTVSAIDNTNANYQLILNNGTLTIVGGGKLTVEATVNSGWNRYSAVIANGVGGNLTVKGVEIEHLGGTDMAYGIDNLTNGKGTKAVTTIENATVKSPYRAVRQFLNGVEATNELYVKSGAVLEGTNKSIFFHDPSKNANSGKLVVEAGAQLKGDVYLYVTAGSTEWPVEVSIAESALVGESTVVTGNVPTGYIVTNENGAYVVAEVTVANDQASLEAAIKNGEETVIVAAGEYTFPASSVKAGQTIICEEDAVFTGTSSLNINGATVVGATFKNVGGQAVSGTIYGNFKDCTFEGHETLRWCYTTAGQTTLFENCVVKTTLRGVHFDGMDGDVIFRNCEVNGFNAYSGAGNITFEGCTFGNDASNYNGLNIYSNTNLVNCTFNFKSGKTNFIDMEGTGKTLTITNCTATLDGAAANVADFVGGSMLAQNTVVIK